MYLFSLTTAMLGFHVYKDVWEPTVAGVSLIKWFLSNGQFCWVTSAL